MPDSYWTPLTVQVFVKTAKTLELLEEWVMPFQISVVLDDFSYLSPPVIDGQDTLEVSTYGIKDHTRWRILDTSNWSEKSIILLLCLTVYDLFHSCKNAYKPPI